MNKKTKSREDRVRRRLAKLGYRLSKVPARSRLRRKHGVGYLVTHGRYVVLGYGRRPFTARLKQVEAYWRQIRYGIDM